MREEKALLPGGVRPADVLLPHWAGGRHAALDVCVVSSLQAGLVAKEAEEPGSALKHRHQQKWNKYGEACLKEGLVFIPLACQVLGAWSEMAIETISRLSDCVAMAGGQPKSDAKRHLFGRLSILLMKGNT